MQASHLKSCLGYGGWGRGRDHVIRDIADRVRGRVMVDGGTCQAGSGSGNKTGDIGIRRWV